VAGESIGAPEKYGSDRFFAYLRLEGDENYPLDRQVAALEANGHPVARIDLNDKQDIGQEFFRWEFAVAAAGAAIGIHPFNQPDVQLAKDLARDAMSGGENARIKLKDEVAAAEGAALGQAVASWLGKTKSRDYVVVQAYIEPSRQHAAKLQTICAVLKDRLGIAATLGFGPRFLHSTGQLHKGGPNSALILQIVDQPSDHLAVPETNYTFDELIHAQAIGDFAALKQRRRRVLRINLGGDPVGGLERLADSVRE
jgi:transaldolase/glucose-6-phosphate isomerase